MAYYDNKWGKTVQTNLNIYLGNIEIATERREAYDKAAKKEGIKSTGEWAKKYLDKAAGYVKKSNE